MEKRLATWVGGVIAAALVLGVTFAPLIGLAQPVTPTLSGASNPISGTSGTFQGTVVADGGVIAIPEVYAGEGLCTSGTIGYGFGNPGATALERTTGLSYNNASLAVCLNGVKWLDVNSGTGNTEAVGAFNSSAASPQFACTAASACGVQSASGQTLGVDCGGGTCTAQLGATNATTATVGRSGQTTNINGNATFGTAGPNLGGAVTGTWSPFASGLLVASTNYGAFQMAASITNVKFRQVTCTHGTAGAGTNGTLAIRNVTDSTTLCSGSYTCTTTANTPTAIFDCNQTPLASKAYAIQFSTGCGTTQVTNLDCSIEIAH